MDFPDVIDKLIKERKRRYIDQKDVAALIGVSKQNLNNWEKKRSRPKVEILQAWARAIGLELVFEVTDDPGLQQATQLALLLEGQDESRREWVLKFARLAHTMEDGDFRMIRALLREAEDDHELRLRSGTSRPA